MNKETIIKGVKTTLGVVAGFGITLLCSAMAGTVSGSSNSGKIQKALMALGGAVVGGMVAKQANAYLNTEIDKIVTEVDEVVTAVKTASNQPKPASENET